MTPAGVPRRDAPVLIQVQHLMGIGHLQRAMTLAEALAAAGHPVTVVSGGMPVPGVARRAGRAGVTLEQLPPTRAADLSYKTLLDEHGEPVDDAWRAERRRRAAAIARAASPRVIITETWPFGRRMLAAEFEAVLDAAASVRSDVRVLASIRDILEGFTTPGERVDRVMAVLASRFDAVLVHGDAGLAGLGESFVGAADIPVPVYHTGYVGPSESDDAKGRSTRSEEGEVVVSAGGGVVGRELVEAALLARGLSRRLGERTWRVLVGHNLEDAVFDDLASRAPAGVIVERNRPDFRSLLRAASVSISQAGYNTAVDVMTTGVRAVLAPFRSDTQREQRVRAEHMARLGLAVAVAPESLDAATLAQAADRAMDLEPLRDRPALDGAAETARLVGELLDANAAPGDDS